MNDNKRVRNLDEKKTKRFVNNKKRIKKSKKFLREKEEAKREILIKKQMAERKKMRRVKKQPKGKKTLTVKKTRQIKQQPKGKKTPQIKKQKKRSNKKKVRGPGVNQVWGKKSIPDGIFGNDGSLISGKGKSNITESREDSPTTSGIKNKQHSKRIARKCSTIHPHCSICGRCHTNRTTHDRGHP
tara:strand:+ start:1059 stop:1613 length:555 start_codon:yes stop_codon:yes gene_type:complete